MRLIFIIPQEIKKANKGSKYSSDVYFYKASALFGGKATALAIENYQSEKMKKIVYNVNKLKLRLGGIQMKNHKFWAWAMVVCLIMTIYTGYEHK